MKLLTLILTLMLAAPAFAAPKKNDFNLTAKVEVESVGGGTAFHCTYSRATTNPDGTRGSVGCYNFDGSHALWSATFVLDGKVMMAGFEWKGSEHLNATALAASYPARLSKNRKHIEFVDGSRVVKADIQWMNPKGWQPGE